MTTILSKKICLLLMMTGGALFLFAILGPFWISEMTSEPDLAVSGFVTLCIATFLYFKAPTGSGHPRKDEP